MLSRAAAALVLLSCSVVACAQLPVQLPGPSRIWPGEQAAATEAEIADDLLDFAARGAGIVSAAADAIAAASDDPQIDKRTLLWKLQVVPLLRETAFDDDPREGFVRTLTLVVMMRQYLTEGDGRALFGEQQSIAARAAQRLEEDLLAVGTGFLTSEQVARVQAEVAEFAVRRPITGTDFTVQRLQRALAEAETSTRFDFVTSLPLAPFRALEGVSSGAAAIHEFNGTARRFARIVEGLPEQVRWQSELLLYEAEDRRTITAALAAMETLAASADRFSLAADALPEDLAATLADSQAALAQASQALASARELLPPLAEVAGRIDHASTTWSALLTRERPDDRPRRPFDIREWQAAAAEIGTSAEELRSLAVEARALVESQELDGALAHVGAGLDRAEGSARELIDAAAWRLLALIVAFFALLLVYRAITSRLLSRTT